MSNGILPEYTETIQGDRIQKCLFNAEFMLKWSFAELLFDSGGSGVLERFQHDIEDVHSGTLKVASLLTAYCSFSIDEKRGRVQILIQTYPIVECGVPCITWNDES